MRGKILAFPLLILAMVLVLSACGSSSSGAAPSQSKTKTHMKADQGQKKSVNKNKKTTDQKTSAANTTKAGSNKSQSAARTNTKSKSKTTSSQTNNGSSTNSSSSTATKEQSNGHVLNVTARDFTFNKKTYVVQSGKITIHFKSVQGTHGFALYNSPGSTTKIVNIIGKGTKTVTLKPGKYYIHCSVVCGGGHGNMDAHLIVK